MKVKSWIRAFLLATAVCFTLTGAWGCSKEVERTPGATAFTSSEEFTVLPLQTATISIEMHEGETLTGRIAVSGGNNDIVVYIKDDYGNMITDLGTVDGSREFVCRPDEPGFYTIYFDNSFSAAVNKQVTLQYRVR